MAGQPFIENDLLTVAQVAKKVQMRPETIRHAIGARELAAFRFGNEYRIDPEDFAKWLDEHRVEAQTQGKPVPLRRADSSPYALGEVAS